MLNLLFPKACNGCKSVLSKREKVLCTNCLHSLPLACHHRTGSSAMKDIFYGRFPLQTATAMVRFQKKGITQEILHNLKYRGQKGISSYFGAWLGAEIAEMAEYQKVDMIIPVPLHAQRLKKRGYNQVEGFGMEISKALKKPYHADILLKISKTDSQVFKQRFKRLRSEASSEEIFTVRNLNKIKNKHILLVDDIVTTGATLENCALQLLRNTNAKLSIATIAIA